MRNKIKKCKNYLLIELYRKDGSVTGYAKVDESARQSVESLRWFKTGKGYVNAHSSGKIIQLHQLIIGKKYVDHINGDTLDNRLGNLRQVTHSQNKMNRPETVRNVCGCKGVMPDRARGGFIVQLISKPMGVKIFKRFKDLDQAILYRKKIERHYFGKYNYKKQ